jgi:hypothetical protein
MPLGVLGIECWARKEEKRPKKKGKKKMSGSDYAGIADKESARWGRQVDAAEEAVGGRASLVHVMDREGDAYPQCRSVSERAKDALERVRFGGWTGSVWPGELAPSFDTEARRAQRYGTEVPERMEGPGAQAPPAPSLPGDLQAAMGRRARIGRTKSTGQSHPSWRKGVRVFRGSPPGSLSAPSAGRTRRVSAPSAYHRSTRSRAVVRPPRDCHLRRWSLSPGQLCSSPQIHSSVKPLCSPRLRGEFSRRRCSAGRPPCPSRPEPALNDRHCAYPLLCGMAESAMRFVVRLARERSVWEVDKEGMALDDEDPTRMSEALVSVHRPDSESSTWRIQRRRWSTTVRLASARKAAVTSAGCGGAGGRRARGTRRPSSTGHGNGAGSVPAPAPRRP